MVKIFISEKSKEKELMAATTPLTTLKGLPIIVGQEVVDVISPCTLPQHPESGICLSLKNGTIIHPMDEGMPNTFAPWITFRSGPMITQRDPGRQYLVGTTVKEFDPTMIKLTKKQGTTAESKGYTFQYEGPFEVHLPSRFTETKEKKLIIKEPAALGKTVVSGPLYSKVVSYLRPSEVSPLVSVSRASARSTTVRSILEERKRCQEASARNLMCLHPTWPIELKCTDYCNDLKLDQKEGLDKREEYFWSLVDLAHHNPTRFQSTIKTIQSTNPNVLPIIKNLWRSYHERVAIELGLEPRRHGVIESMIYDNKANTLMTLGPAPIHDFLSSGKPLTTRLQEISDSQWRNIADIPPMPDFFV